MRSWIIVLLLILAFGGMNEVQGQEEFTGPLQGWANVKKRFGAKGDGKQDDTKAIQLALDSLTVTHRRFNSGSGAYTVLYLPKGKYRISKTLVLKGKIGIMIIGEDPMTTSFDWEGSDGDTMMLCNGASYFRISRISWNAKNHKNIECLGIHWLNKWNDGSSQSYAPLNIELSDLRFIGKPAVGIGTGTYGNGTGQTDSEITFRRCYFEGAQIAGIKIMGYNALDNWIWSSTFKDCAVAVHSSYGNYHAYSCQFIRSKTSDFLNKNGYYTSVRHSVSIDSRAFSLDEGSSSNPFKRTFQDNRVVNTLTMPIEYYHAGSLTLMDNEFTASRDTAAPFMVNHKNWAPITQQLLSIGNKYGYFKMPIRVPVENKQVYMIKDQPLLERMQKMPKSDEVTVARAPVFSARKVYEVPVQATDEEIQRIIQLAARSSTGKAIVHFSTGVYTLDKTIEIPANADIQLVGDGLRGGSLIIAANPETFSGKALFLVKGPTAVVFRDLQLGTAMNKRKLTAIQFQQVDQPGASIILDQVHTASDTSLFINKLNYARFEKNNSFFSDGNIIIGGEVQKAGKGTLAVYAFCGQYAGLKVLNGARFIARDCWWEGNNPQPLNFEGDGRITIDGAKIAPNKGDSSTIIRVGNFGGSISLMNMYIQGGLDIKGPNPALSLMVWNANYYYKKNINGAIPGNMQGRVLFAGTTSQCFYKEDPDCKVIRGYESRFVNIADKEQFISDMTTDDRNAKPAVYKKLGKGISNIYMSRVSFDSFNIALQFNN